jgi:DNA-binding response OmpR family regulator
MLNLAAEIGADAIRSKPLSTEELLEAVMELLRPAT